MSADHNMTPTDDCPASFIDGECNDGSDANCDDDRSSSTSSWYTPTSSICAIVSNAHSTYRSGRTRSISYRKSQLRGMLRLMNENSNELSNALHRDMGQGRMYVAAFEIDVLRTRCRTALNNLDDWTRTSNVLTPWPFNLSIPIRSEISIEPRGVVTIITPWNMPLLLSLSPLIDALASGNVCILKMSELSVRTTRLLSSLLTSGAYVDADVVNVINGDAETCTELLKYRVDAISYTGGTKIGRIIASAAAYHLTPTLLELGGKNPCFVTRHAHLRSAALRICWGKITGNAGQMCICPDYVR
jgi:aldehyde dehydrogenase (NAD+)